MLKKAILTAAIILLFSGCYTPDPLNQHTSADIIVYIKNQNGEFCSFYYDTATKVPDIHFYSRRASDSDWYYWGDESLEKFVEFFSVFTSK